MEIDKYIEMSVERMRKKSDKIIGNDTNFFTLIKHNITPLDLFILSNLNEGATLEEIISKAKKEFNIKNAEHTISEHWKKLISDRDPEENIILQPTPQYLINPTKMYENLSMVLIKANLDLSENIMVDVSVENIFETILTLNNKPCYGKPLKQLFTLSGWSYDYLGIIYQNNIDRFRSLRDQLLQEKIASAVDIIAIDTEKGCLFNPVALPEYTEFKEFLVHYQDRMNNMVDELHTKDVDVTKTMRFFEKDTFVLEATSGKQKGEVYPIDMAELKIGRYYDNDVILQDVVVSRRHAKIVRIGNQYLFKDQSTNGSLVNDTKLVYDEVELHDGDIITIGKHTFTFHKNHDIKKE